ncbi:MAG TPA: hypothetical protein PLR96_04970 [Flavobacteriales bacterium]|nr:hypothetical protein [Flavobacteriales bacterium]
MRTNLLFTICWLFLLFGVLYLQHLLTSSPPIDQFSDGQAGIGNASVFLMQAALSLVACALFIAQGLHIAFTPNARNFLGYLNLFLLLAVPLVFWLGLRD